MRVSVTGLGDMVDKAYLPVLSALPEVELHLSTRNAEVLAQAGRRFRVAGPHGSVADALRTTRFDAAFVHAATGAHPTLVRADDILATHRLCEAITAHAERQHSS